MGPFLPSTSQSKGSEQTSPPSQPLHLEDDAVSDGLSPSSESSFYDLQTMTVLR